MPHYQAVVAEILFFTALMNLRVQISSISDIFDSVMSAVLFTLRLVLSWLALTCGWSQVEFQPGVGFCFENSKVELIVNGFQGKLAVLNLTHG